MSDNPIASWRWWSGLMSKPIRKRRIERGEVMGDVMLNGVLNMPLPEHPEDCDIVTWVQFKAASRQAADRIEELEADLRQAKISEVFWREGWHTLDQDKRELEAKLAKAVVALTAIMCNCVGDVERCGTKAAIAELTGDRDE